jgi:hypothetical protein
MCKKNYVLMKRKKSQFKLCVDDISAVYKAIQKKRPAIPAYETPT